MDDDAIYDPTQWDDFVPDYGTPRFSNRGDTPATQSQQLNPNLRLPLLQLSEWDEACTYNEKPPTCIHYSVQWRVLVNTGSRSTKLTYQPERIPNLTLAPGAYWSRSLKSTVEQRIKQKTPANKRYEPEETNIIVSLSDRAIEDLLLRFDGINIEWEKIEQQLVTWSPLHSCGKKLHIEITIICKPTSKSSSTNTRSNGKRGATGRQHAQIEAEDEEREAAGQASNWNRVYTMTRCQDPRPACTGRQCIDDDRTGKHMSLDGEVMREIIAYCDAGNKFEAPKDLPKEIWDMVEKKHEAEERRKEDKKRKRSELPLSNPPVQLIFPSSFNQAAADLPVGFNIGHTSVEPEWSIPEPIDVGIHRYGTFQRARVVCEKWKEGFRKAETITLRDCLDLRYVYEEKDITFLTSEGVPTGIAKSWVRDIKEWALALKEHDP
ncbi:hypothetical protein HJFPF1_08369 [Paramyrothecium foliicola]|nr:hypothetical protein HJFPF1_10699 [Paramyrothecium foliicola]KAI9155780.1 hypothetical protein HJFPF1_08369 [Paramyrothecium foliicola]